MTIKNSIRLSFPFRRYMHTRITLSEGQMKSVGLPKYPKSLELNGEFHPMYLC